MHLLVVEDDPKLGRLLTRLLQDDRHVVELAADGETGLEIAREAPGHRRRDPRHRPARHVRPRGGAPAPRASGSRVGILMLTARDTAQRPRLGLDAGADDYLVKPFAYEELAARLRALGRRVHSARGPRGRAARQRPDRARRGPARVTVDGRDVNLSPREFALLECLLRHPGQVMSRDQLLDQAWPFGVAVTLNAVDAYVHYLREKLGDGGRRGSRPSAASAIGCAHP